MRKYLFSLFLTSILCLLLLLVVFGWLMPERQISGYYLTLFWYMLLTLGGHLWLIKTLSSNPRCFKNRHLIVTVLKVLLLLIFVVIYLLIERREVISFIIANLVLYLTYTLFEVNALKKALKQATDKQN